MRVLGAISVVSAWLFAASVGSAECPEVNLRITPTAYNATHNEEGGVESRILEWGIPASEVDDGTFVYDVCLTYYGGAAPPDPPCVQTKSPGPVGFDVLAGWRFDVQSSVMVDGEVVWSDHSLCALITDPTDLNADGATGVCCDPVVVPRRY